MKRALFLLICLPLMFTQCSKDDSGNGTDDPSNGDVTLMKKYEIEKGIITFESSDDLSNEVSMYKIFFTDYGAKEVKYEYNAEGVLEEITMQKGDGWFYQISLKYGGGTKSESLYANGTEMQFDFEDWSESIKEEYNCRQLADTTICGKTCQAYYYEASTSTSAVAAGYKGITLYFRVQYNSGLMFTVINRAISLEENVAISDTVWNLPANITITESK